MELGFVEPPRLQAYPSVPIRATQELKPVRITEPDEGVFIFDMGQNFSGVVRLKVRGPRGARVRIRHGEMLHADGRLMTENLRRARATDTYILRGDEAGETWTPRFTYHGFQYVELTGYPGRPEMDAVTGIVLHSDTPMASSFECSDEMVNKLFSNIVWTQRANFFEVPTDCPQRDERLGWTGDAQAYIRAATYNADVAAFFTKWFLDLTESQLDNGAYPAYAPFPMQHGVRGKAFGSAWMDAGIICPYTIYKVYGDRRVIERHYESMKRFMDFRRRISPDYRGVFVGNDWGDWLSMGKKTPITFIDAAYSAYTAKLMSEMAAAIGNDTDAAGYRRTFANIQTAFLDEYVQRDGTLMVDTQTAYALALNAGLLPERLRRRAADRLAQMVRDNDTRMSTGFLGTRLLLPVLTAAGHHDLAAQLLQSRKFPSWGYEVINGATSIWERWNSYTKEEGFGEARMNSFSHYAFGAVSEWMFQSLAGIDTDGAGFKKIVIRPGAPSPGSNPDHTPIHWVRAAYDSVHGRIVSNWQRDEQRFALDVTIPANTTATVFVPAAKASDVTEGGRSLDAARGVRFLRMEGDRAVVAVESGSYRFAAAAPRANVIVFLADDMGWMDSSTYGSEFFRTPNLDRLARRGMLFTDAYAAAPLCSPSRAAILTGKYPGRLRITHAITYGGGGAEVYEPKVEETAPPGQPLLMPQRRTYLPLDEFTLAEALTQAGYATVHVGKWHLGQDRWRPQKHGFGVNIGGDHRPGNRYFPPYGNLPNVPDGPAGEYLTDRLTTEAIRFIVEHKDRPFFLNFWHYAVHSPWMGKPKLVELYKPRVQPGYPQRNPTMGAMIHSLDESLGRVLDELDRLGIAGNTIFVFTSDNGGVDWSRDDNPPPTSNLPLRAGKASLYEGGTRAPLIVSWPGVARSGSRCPVPVNGIDLYPTILEMLGLRPKVGYVMDGVSIVPLLKGADSLRREALFWHFPRFRPVTSVRRGNLKLLRFYGEGADHTRNGFELYDLAADIGERNNLAGEMPEVVAELDALIGRHLRQTRALTPAPNPRFDPARAEKKNWHYDR